MVSDHYLFNYSYETEFRHKPIKDKQLYKLTPYDDIVLLHKKNGMRLIHPK